jgi:hypothetical protein
MKLVRIHGQASWRFASDQVEAAITRQGGHLAPVRFHLPQGVVEPYAIAPWAEEKLPPETAALLRPLRGDFFCAPFGGNAKAWRGERHPAHGETAQGPWHFESMKKSETGVELRLSLETKIRPGRVEKLIRLRKGETAVYCRHVLSGMAGKMSLGHHAMLQFPEMEGSGLIGTSPLRFGQVFPGAFEEPAQKGYSFLQPGAFFSRLDQVPAADGSVADLSRYGGA